MSVSRTVLAQCSDCGGKVHQDEDVLDTWFSSALWPFSTLGWPDATPELDYFYPTDVLVTGYDIIFFWVARMIFSGLEFTGQKPFSTVLINGLVRDAKGQKMSKSAGNGIDPLELIDRYGADALRFSLLNGIATGADQRFSAEKVESSRNFMNKIYNASRFVLSNCKNAVIKFDITKLKNLSLADKWILTRLNETAAAITKSLDKYETGQATAMLYDFTWSTLCDWYIECAKVNLNSDNPAVQSTTQAVLLHVLKQTLIMLHPFVPFITEEIYQALPNKDSDSIMQALFPAKGKSYKKDAIEFELIMEAVRAVRNFRAEKNIPPSKKLRLFLTAKAERQKTALAALDYLKRLAGAAQATLVTGGVDGEIIEIITTLATIYMPKSDFSDTGEELARLKKELTYIESELALAQKKLANPGFIQKAPKSLIDAEEAKVNKFTDLKNKLTASIAAL